MSKDAVTPKWLEDVVLLLGEEKVRKVLRLSIAHGDVHSDEAERLRRIVGPRSSKTPTPPG